MNKRPSRGFTLIELMITVAIVAILASVAYPAYTSHLVRGKRTAAASFMLNVANRQEQAMLNSRAYFAVADNAGWAANKIALPADVSASYTVTVVTASSPPAYTVTAAPTGYQLAKDTKCLSLTYNELGRKGASGAGTDDAAIGQCWR